MNARFPFGDQFSIGDQFPLRMIVSGGQTGVDRAALDTAIFLDLEHGGWCPQGRRAEDGVIDPVYRLTETKEYDYAVRTEKNVIDSDATLILCTGRLTGGTRLTERFARQHQRNYLVIDIGEALQDDHARTEAINSFLDWIKSHNIQKLNVAGPRESTAPGIAKLAESFLLDALR